jgi:glycosyltransferase involved in cell wall biosynthesis
MRALFLTPSLRAGGAERQTSILLPGLRRRGVDARIIALDGGGPFVAPLRAAGVPVEVLDMRHQLDLFPLARSRLASTFRPDVIVSRGVSGLYVGHALSLWRRAAHVHNDHRPVGVEVSHRRRLMTRMLARRLRAVIVVSEDQRDEWFEMGCRPEQVVLIANGVPIPPAPPAGAGIREELGIPQEAVVALLVARMRPVKRVPDFVRVVRSAREERPELIAVIAGDGDDRALVDRLAEGDPAIRVLGHRDDVARLLSAADVFVLASDFEALPMAILEAMAAGLPVLTTRSGAIPTVVSDGESGLLVEPGDMRGLRDGLVRLAGDPELRRAMGTAGQRRCRESWDAEMMIDSYLGALQDAVARGRPLR